MDVIEIAKQNQNDHDELVVLNAVINLLKLKGVINRGQTGVDLVTYEIREMGKHKKDEVSQEFARILGIRYELIVRNNTPTDAKSDENYLRIFYNGKSLEMTHHTPLKMETILYTVDNIVDVAKTINDTETIINALTTPSSHHG